MVRKNSKRVKVETPSSLINDHESEPDFIIEEPAELVNEPIGVY